MLYFHGYCLSLINHLCPLTGAITSVGKLSPAASRCFSSNRRRSGGRGNAPDAGSDGNPDPTVKPGQGPRRRESEERDENGERRRRPSERGSQRSIQLSTISITNAEVLQAAKRRGIEISEPVVACISDLTFKFTDGPNSDLFIYYCKHCGSHLLITGRAWDLSFHYLFPIRLFQILFFSGVTLTIGFRSTLQFFMKRQNFKEMVQRGREARMILEVLREQMDDGDAAKAGRRSFKQRLRLTGIGCCGAAWVSNIRRKNISLSTRRLLPLSS